MSRGKKWLWRLFLLGFVVLVTMGLWLPPIITHAVEKDYHFSEVEIDATVLPNGDMVLEETRTFDFQNGPFTYAYFNVDDPLDHVRDFSIAEKLDDGSEVALTPDYASHSIVTEGFQAQWSYQAEDETRTWVFRYRVACAVDVYTDTAHLYWQFIGSGWDVPTEHALITVHLLDAPSMGLFPRRQECNPDDHLAGSPEDLALERGDVRAFAHGPLNGEVTFLDPQTIRYDVSDVPARSYIEGSIRSHRSSSRPHSKRTSRAATDPRPGACVGRRGECTARAPRDRSSLVLYLLIGVPVALALLVLLARYRDRVPGVPKVLEQPPEDDPVQGSLLWSAWQGHLSPQNAYRAQVLKLASLGAIERSPTAA